MGEGTGVEWLLGKCVCGRKSRGGVVVRGCLREEGV